MPASDVLMQSPPIGSPPHNTNTASRDSCDVLTPVKLNFDDLVYELSDEDVPLDHTSPCPVPVTPQHRTLTESQLLTLPTLQFGEGSPFPENQLGLHHTLNEPLLDETQLEESCDPMQIDDPYHGPVDNAREPVVQGCEHMQIDDPYLGPVGGDQEPVVPGCDAPSTSPVDSAPPSDAPVVDLSVPVPAPVVVSSASVRAALNRATTADLLGQTTADVEVPSSDSDDPIDADSKDPKERRRFYMRFLRATTVFDPNYCWMSARLRITLDEPAFQF